MQGGDVIAAAEHPDDGDLHCGGGEDDVDVVDVLQAGRFDPIVLGQIGTPAVVVSAAAGDFPPAARQQNIAKVGVHAVGLADID